MPSMSGADATISALVTFKSWCPPAEEGTNIRYQIHIHSIILLPSHIRWGRSLTIHPALREDSSDEIMWLISAK